MTVDREDVRRPIASRSSAWAIAVSARLAAWGISPNSISVASVAFAALGGAAILFAGSWVLFLRSGGLRAAAPRLQPA